MCYLTLKSREDCHSILLHWYARLVFGNSGLWTKSSMLPVFINKVLLEHSHIPLFPHCDCFPIGAAEAVVLWQRLCTKSKIFTVLWRISLLMPTLDFRLLNTKLGFGMLMRCINLRIVACKWTFKHKRECNVNFLIFLEKSYIN